MDTCVAIEREWVHRSEVRGAGNANDDGDSRVQGAEGSGKKEERDGFGRQSIVRAIKQRLAPPFNRRDTGRDVVGSGGTYIPKPSLPNLLILTGC